MVREIVTVSCGAAGIGMADTMWRQYCVEHCILKDGTLMENEISRNDNNIHCFFTEKATSGGQGDGEGAIFIPRNLILDSTSGNINVDGIAGGDLSGLYNCGYLLDRNMGSAINYARAYYAIGDTIMEDVREQIRKLLNDCDSLNGFLVMNSIVGGTGSGLTALVLENIIDCCGKKTNLFGGQLYPRDLSTELPPVISSYNTLLSTNKLINHKNMVSIIFDNKALYKQRKKDCVFLSYTAPSNSGNASSYHEINKVASMRFSGNHLPCDLADYHANLVSVPRLHFMVTSMSSRSSKTRKKMKTKKTKKTTLQSITEKNFQKKNFGVQFSFLFFFCVLLCSFVCCLSLTRGFFFVTCVE